MCRQCTLKYQLVCRSAKKGTNDAKRVQILIKANFGYQQLIMNDKNFVSFDLFCPNKIKLLNEIQPIINTGFESFKGLFRITIHFIKIFILTAFLVQQTCFEFSFNIQKIFISKNAHFSSRNYSMFGQTKYTKVLECTALKGPYHVPKTFDMLYLGPKQSLINR